MANALKRSIGEASTVGSTILTVPVGATVTIIGCRASNKTNTNVKIGFTLNGSYISGSDTDLPANTAIDIMGGAKIVAQENDEFVALCDADTSVDVVISYLEQT